MNLLSEITEGTRISWEAIRGNLLRSVLTTLGIVIGIVTVTLMATAMEGLNGAFRDAISFIGTDVLYVDQREWFIDSSTKWEAVAKRGKITRAQVRAVEQAMSMAKGVSPTVMHPTESVRFKNRSSGLVMIIGTNEQFLVTGGVLLTAGRFMTKAEANANRDLCVIGSEVAEKLFLNESPLGQRIRAGNESLEVIGVLEKRGSVLGKMSLDNQVIIPIGKMFRGFRWDPSCTIQVKVGNPTQIESAREELRGLLRKIRKVPPGQDDDFAINQQEQLLTQFKKVSGVIATAGFFITGLSLFVGGIGIMNIMFVSVAERTHEIGIRKAIGAKRRTILLQFLIEAASICLIGAGIALVIARGMVEVARHYLPRVALSPSVVLLALVVAIATGLVSGFLPAWRAARLSPVEALRNE
ncbi:MAG: putative transport system permease protein [Chthoniobacter sp.]|jgi:putative ABC transport system permease protein|nr:putative transport system permease protein [Chthoniobacter sp.]